MNTNICYSNNIRILFIYRIIRSPLDGIDGIYATDEFIEVMEAKVERDIQPLLKTSFL